MHYINDIYIHFISKSLSNDNKLAKGSSISQKLFNINYVFL